MKRIYKGYQNQIEPLKTGSVRFGSERFFVFQRPELQLAVRFFAVRSGPVSVFFQFDEPDLQTLQIGPVLGPFPVLWTGHLSAK
jgi:hypothetical protein